MILEQYLSLFDLMSDCDKFLAIWNDPLAFRHWKTNLRQVSKGGEVGGKGVGKL